MTRPRLACLLAAALLTTSIHAAELQVALHIPRIDVAEYHRPYVAVWVEREDGSVAANLAVWYQQTRAKARDQKTNPATSAANGEDGSRWLPDLRQWWRRVGRSSALPIDGVSGATRPVGRHELRFGTEQAPLAQLEPGHYRLVVEAVREVGGRELLRLPLQWPPAQGLRASVEGKRELSRVELSLKP